GRTSSTISPSIPPRRGTRRSAGPTCCRECEPSWLGRWRPTGETSPPLGAPPPAVRLRLHVRTRALVRGPRLAGLWRWGREPSPPTARPDRPRERRAARAGVGLPHGRPGPDAVSVHRRAGRAVLHLHRAEGLRAAWRHR